MWRTDSLEKTQMPGKIEGGEGGDKGWDGWISSPTWWTWGWASSRSWWWTEKTGPWGCRVGHNWTELNWPAYFSYLRISSLLHPMWVPEGSSVLLLFSCPVVSNCLDTMDCSPPGSFVHGILQARTQEWVAISFSRGIQHSAWHLGNMKVLKCWYRAGGFSYTVCQ